MKMLLIAVVVAGAELAGCAEPTTPSRAPDEQGLSPIELLGKRLFEDPALSEPAGQSCASCHDPQRAFTGTDGSPIDAVARGAHRDVLGARNVPTIMYASFSPPFALVAGDDGLTPTGGQFWDGRAATLAEQALGPLLNPREMANADGAAVVAKVAAAPYAALYADVFGPLDANALAAADADGDANAPGANADTAYANLGVAIAAYESTARFHPFSSPFDAYLRGESDLTPLAARGFELFKDPEKGNCIACHAGDPTSREPRAWLFTDFTYDNLGLPRNAALPDNADATHFDTGLCIRELGVCGAFKVPTLRNVARTAPYGHNGQLVTLRDVVAFYATRDVTPARWYPGRPYDDIPAADAMFVNQGEVPYDRHAGDAPRLTDDEIDAIVAFLETLSD